MRVGMRGHNIMDLYFESSEKALLKCIELKESGDAQFFRGQIQDWATIIPSLLRLSGHKRLEAERELERYLEWAHSVVQMNPYHFSEKGLVAIAQHYGIPTNFLDLTTSPEIAFLFSKTNEDLAEQPAQAVIYCFSESKLQNLKNGRILRINIDNLWRLESQYGLFLEYLDETLESELRDIAIRIHFPATKLEMIEYELIYPQRKSQLETIIDQWFYRRQVETLQEKFGNVARKIGIRRDNSYLGAFVWREIPDISIDWIKRIDNPIGWFHPPVESVLCLQQSTEIILNIVHDNPERSVDFIANLIREPIQNYCITGQQLLLRVDIIEIEPDVSNAISNLLNRCWDGIRVLPYEPTEMIICLARTAFFLLARTLKTVNEENLLKVILGEVELLEVAPVGGHIDTGFVSCKDLENAFSHIFYKNLTTWFQNEAKKSSRLLMKWIVDPSILFDFTRFKRMYIEQFIPSSVDAYWKEKLLHNDFLSDDLWSTSFNPALLGYVTNSEFKFRSPLALEPNPSYIVYIAPEMDEKDIEEAFVHCLPSILEGGSPYQIRFTDYERDPRELWQIERVLQQCQWIVEVSGISVLEVVTDKSDEFYPAGLGAFDIWVYANKLVEHLNGADYIKIKPYFDEFYEKLLYSNDDLEKRLENWKRMR